jgi:hypothetical protein
MKSALEGEWIVSSYFNLLDETRSPILAAAGLADYFELSYQPDQRFSSNPKDSSYWLFIDSSRGFYEGGYPILFDTAKATIDILTRKRTNSFAHIHIDCKNCVDSLLFVKANGDSLTFYRYTKEHIRGSAISSYTNDKVLSGLFYPFTTEGKIDSIHPIRFSRDGYSPDFAMLVKMKDRIVYNILPTRDQTRNQISLYNPNQEIARTLEWEFKGDTLHFHDTMIKNSSSIDSISLIRSANTEK